MESIYLDSSSEEEGNDYLNSVSILKALKAQTSSKVTKEPCKETANKDEDILEITDITVPVARKQPQAKGFRRNPPRRAKRRSQNNSDWDVEIVSVSENPVESMDSDLVILDDKLKIHDQSIEDDNYDMVIKILWRLKKVHRINMLRNENFKKIFDYFADLEGVSVDQVLINKKEKVLNVNDTPRSINLSVIDILEGGIIDKSMVSVKENAEDKSLENACVIKVQTTQKHSLTFTVKKDEDFRELFEKCAKDLNLKSSKIKIYFDGEAISIDETPNSLEIDDEACFDLRTVS